MIIQIEELADKLGPTANWPTQIHVWADVFEEADPSFNREKFIRRATDAWEKGFNPPDIDDRIPY